MQFHQKKSESKANGNGREFNPNDPEHIELALGGYVFRTHSNPLNVARYIDEDSKLGFVDHRVCTNAYICGLRLNDYVGIWAKTPASAARVSSWDAVLGGQFPEELDKLATIDRAMADLIAAGFCHITNTSNPPKDADALRAWQTTTSFTDVQIFPRAYYSDGRLVRNHVSLWGKPTKTDA